MKLALLMMLHNDLPWLKLHLPPIADRFDGIVAATDDPPAQQEEYATFFQSLGIGWRLFYKVFENHWATYLNAIIEEAEAQHYDAVLRLDPDEALFPADVDATRALLETYKVLCLSRYNFWGDRLHYTPGVFPDWQARAWRLGLGIRLGGQFHEGIGWVNYRLFEGDPIADTPRDVLRVPSIVLYHYGDIGRANRLARDLRYLNQALAQQGLPKLTERPADRAFPTRHSIPFHGPQPVDPAVVGATAPFEE